VTCIDCVPTSASTAREYKYVTIIVSTVNHIRHTVYLPLHLNVILLAGIY